MPAQTGQGKTVPSQALGIRAEEVEEAALMADLVRQGPLAPLAAGPMPEVRAGLILLALAAARPGLALTVLVELGPTEEAAEAGAGIIPRLGLKAWAELEARAMWIGMQHTA